MTTEKQQIPKRLVFDQVPPGQFLPNAARAADVNGYPYLIFNERVRVTRTLHDLGPASEFEFVEE